MAPWSWPICVCSNGGCQMTDFYDADGTIDDAEVAADGSCKAKDPHFPDESPKYPVESLFASRSRAKNIDDNGRVHVSPRLAPHHLREQAQVAKYGMDMEKRVAHADAVEAKLRRVRLSYSSRPSSMESRPASMEALEANIGIAADASVSTSTSESKVGEADSSKDTSIDCLPSRHPDPADLQQRQQQVHIPTPHEAPTEHSVCSPARPLEAFPSMTPGRSPTLADALKLADVAIALCKDRSRGEDGDCQASPTADTALAAEEAAKSGPAGTETDDVHDCSLGPANLDAVLQDEEHHNISETDRIADRAAEIVETTPEASVGKNVRVEGQLDFEALWQRGVGGNVADSKMDLEAMWQSEVDSKRTADAANSSQASSAVFVPFTPQLDENQQLSLDDHGASKCEPPLAQSVRSSRTNPLDHDISAISRIEASDNATDVTADSPCRQLDMSAEAGHRQRFSSPRLVGGTTTQDSPRVAMVQLEKLPPQAAVSPSVGGA